MPSFESLSGDAKTDVLIIGGGICGILCAYFLKNAGVDCLLVEANRLASGITKNTTAKITSQHGLIYSKLIKSVGIEKSAMYYEANRAAEKQYRKMCESIECAYEELPAYTYTLNDRRKIEKEVEAANKIGVNAVFTENIELPFKTQGAIKFFSQAQFAPLEFLKVIVKDLNVCENTPVSKIQDNTAITDKGKITAEKIIVATHFPFINSHGGYFLKLYQARSYVIALENAQKLHGMYIDEAKAGMSFRSYEKYLLLGGGGHRTGKSGGAWVELRDFAKRYYPNKQEKFYWAAQDCMSLDGIPYIGNYSKNTPNLYVATGFNKWGMTSSMAAAMILCDMVLEKENEYAPVFSPSRSILKPQLFINGFETVTNLITPTKKRCPHLGCALKWNKAEHTWDCPCHGSRFEQGGKLIENPAMRDLK